MEMLVWVVKDEEGYLRPMAGIWPASGAMGRDMKNVWDENWSKQKKYKGCTLVKATLTEIK